MWPKSEGRMKINKWIERTEIPCRQKGIEKYKNQH